MLGLGKDTPHLCDQLIPRGAVRGCQGGAQLKQKALSHFCVLFQTQTEMCQIIRNRKMNPAHPPMLMQQLYFCLCGAEFHGMPTIEDPFCVQHCGVYLQVTDVCFWPLFRRTYERCLPEADPAQQSNVQLLSEWSVRSDSPTQTPNRRCEKDKHILQNISHQRRRYFRIYSGVFNATKRPRENHLWRKCWE